MTRILALTGRVPYSTTEEAFVQDELAGMIAAGADLVVAPARLQTSQPNPDSVTSGVARVTVSEPLVSPRVLLAAVRVFARRPIKVLSILVSVCAGSGSFRNMINNLAAFPKALWLADLATREGIEHVHAFWLAHTATMALVIGRVTGIPWSATGYRWDIDAANCLTRKATEAAFLRVADELGDRQLTQTTTQIGRPEMVHLVRTGVEVPPATTWSRVPLATDVWCCPGAFVTKKGHRYLLEAVRHAVDAGRGPKRVDLFGDGPLRSQIEADIQRLGLTDRVILHGIVSLPALRAALRSERPIVVLPSIRANDGQEEGIPVVLIEAMSNGCPVVSTRTGCIPTLVTEGAGWLVDERDPWALYEAIATIGDDRARAEAVTATAYQRVAVEFALEATSARMLALISDVRGTP